MAMIPTCPRCRAVLAGTGGREKCPRCGEVVVAFTRKFCRRCGEDISNTHRFRDADGEYFCEPCWLQVCAECGATPAYPCSECGGWFDSEHAYQLKRTYVCTGCYDAHTSGVTSGDYAEATLVALAGAEEAPEEAAAAVYAPSPYTANAGLQVAINRQRSQQATTRLLVGSAVAVVVLITLIGFWLAMRG